MNLDPILQWIKHTPSLLYGTETIAGQAPFDQQTDFSVADYHGNPRLGFLYQYLCGQLFTHSRRFELCAEEIQLIEHHKTLGAIDFITENLQTSHIEHWEVAIKFYLLFNGKWYGPNAQDRLDKKLSHMLNHQLAMSRTAVFLKHYPQWKEAKPQLLMQGRLYTNPFMPEPIPKTCLGMKLNPTQITGHWCYQSQVSLITSPLYALHRHQWMIGTINHPRETISPLDTPTHYQDHQQRFWFVVPDNWPQIKK